MYQLNTYMSSMRLADQPASADFFLTLMICEKALVSIVLGLASSLLVATRMRNEDDVTHIFYSQGYQLEFLPVTVTGIPSMHICLDFIPELLHQQDIEKQV